MGQIGGFDFHISKFSNYHIVNLTPGPSPKESGEESHKALRIYGANRWVFIFKFPNYHIFKLSTYSTFTLIPSE
jgi:hypothetical protein